MRIISGISRGRKLKPVPGDTTRPTADRVKEAVFTIIQFELEGRRVLDIFAGTGQMGIEALSRGAASAVFVDNSKEAIAVIRDNLAHSDLGGSATVLMSDYKAFLKRAEPESFDIIFLDPPYSNGYTEKNLALIGELGVLSRHGLVVSETAREEKLPEALPGLVKAREYYYGIAKIAIFRPSERG